MTTENFRNAHQAKPFRPFTIHLADGEKVHVRHPESAFQSQGGRTVIVNEVDERLSIVDLLLVTRLTYDDEATTRGNGQGQPTSG